MSSNVQFQPKPLKYTIEDYFKKEEKPVPEKRIEAPQSKGSGKRPFKEVIDLTEKSSSEIAKETKKMRTDFEVDFLYGKESHIQAYVQCIDSAEEQIIIASWNLNYIQKEIFSSLMRAKRRGVSISIVVQDVKRQQTVDYFDKVEDLKDSVDYCFTLHTTKSHAKFLMIDSKNLILGSFNALGDSFEENIDASLKIKGTVQQLWPSYMAIYDTYLALGEDHSQIFDAIAAISRSRYGQPRQLLQQNFDQFESKMTLLRTIKEHEDFLRLAVPYNGDVSIFSPFSTKDNTLKRLQALERLVPSAAKVSLKVLPKFKEGLLSLLPHVPSLEKRVSVESVMSHQKVMILGEETICIGSLNWLSAAQDPKEPYSNVELSIVLQGLKAKGIIQQYYSSKT